MTDKTVKSKEQQIIDWLISGEISFPKIASIYSTYLEEKWKFDREQVVDLAMIANMYRTPKMNGGSKKDLETRFAQAMLKTKLFQGTSFEKELEKKV